MPYCSSCGSPIPEGQDKSCSMCYGDPYYGRDEYYLQMMEEQAQQEIQRQREVEEQDRQINEQ